MTDGVVVDAVTTMTALQVSEFAAMRVDYGKHDEPLCVRVTIPASEVARLVSPDPRAAAAIRLAEAVDESQMAKEWLDHFGKEPDIDLAYIATHREKVAKIDAVWTALAAYRSARALGTGETTSDVAR